MPGEFTYFRKYIILRNNYTNIANVNPKGHVKVEVRGSKGTINLNVENCEWEADYKVYLLKDINGEVYEYELGRIITDEKGRSKTNMVLNLRDLESKGFSIDEIDAILIRKGISVLLGGYIDNDNGAIDRFIKKLILGKKEETTIRVEEVEEVEEEIEVEEVEEPPIEYSESLSISEESPEVIAIGENEEVEKSIEEPEEIEELIEEPEEIIEEIENVDFQAAEDIEETLENVEEEPEQVLNQQDEQDEQEQQEQQEYQDYQSLEYIRRLNHKNQMTNYILSILRFFPYVQPLRMNLHGYSWWRIENDGTDSYKGFLPYYNYLMSTDYKYPFLNNSTTCLNLIRKYNHYLFGMYKEGRETKYYIYGVPGKFTVQEHPFKGITGFNTWYESVDGLGYWILYIDPMTGKIIYPLNPMVPAY